MGWNLKSPFEYYNSIDIPYQIYLLIKYYIEESGIYPLTTGKKDSINTKEIKKRI